MRLTSAADLTHQHADACESKVYTRSTQRDARREEGPAAAVSCVCRCGSVGGLNIHTYIHRYNVL